ncbi:hypothetical protein FHX15_000763 [Rhizobium sp. BK650]|uniref:hypothetical protein n=1 Tax=Rhizobium sp. BK650 TaxID=2586990 RepID=UPI001615470C|nr:hypothetical protein [Rhizobium sp. BK650]MBB3655564.1 hypothetical protein [Rhizobium sp. BK650]
MKTAAIKPYRCLCIECQPLPPIEDPHPLTYGGETANEARKPKRILGVIAELVMPSRPQDGGIE